MGAYVKKTARRAYEERSFSVRAVHRDPPDLHKLAQLFVNMALSRTETEQHRSGPGSPQTTSEAVES